MLEYFVEGGIKCNRLSGSALKLKTTTTLFCEPLATDPLPSRISPSKRRKERNEYVRRDNGLQGK
jgi:hypothetical protein